jgi:hypothetical protein
MALGFVRENFQSTVNTGDGSRVVSSAVTLTAGMTAGDTLVLFFCSDSADALNTFTISDTKLNTWTKDVYIAANGIMLLVASTRMDVGTLTTADTVTVATSGIGWDVAVVWGEELSGLATASAVDKTATNSGAGATSQPTGTTAATTNAQEIAVAFAAIKLNSALTKDAAYTAFTTGSKGVTAPGPPIGRIAGFPTYKILAATGTQSATYTSASAAFVAAIVTYKAAAPVLAVTGIASGEAFGSGDKVIRVARAVGITTGEAFGSADRLARVLGLVGVQGGEAFGQIDSLTRVISPAGIATAETFGSASAVRLLAPSAIAPAEAWGNPLVFAVAPAFVGIETNVLVTDASQVSAVVSDVPVLAVVVGDTLVEYVLEIPWNSDSAVSSVNVSDQLADSSVVSDG